VEPGSLAAQDMTEPGELARRDKRQRRVGRLEDLTAFIEHVAPGGLLAGNARLQHEVVAPAGDRDRVELDRPELPKDLEHPVETSRERPRRREEVPRDEKATRRLGSDLHPQDTSPRALTGSRRRTRFAERQTLVCRGIGAVPRADQNDTFKIEAVQETLLHTLVAAPVMLGIAFVALRRKRPSRTGMLGFSLLLFLVSYSLFCATCE
jgi:hypothetical protein